ncbi:MAG TPA: hypothetical protein VHZ76_02135 [Gammaproteobacteria bacterium]|nr:hypothetical protein [Gammaproteobacteria bacterium]
MGPIVNPIGVGEAAVALVFLGGCFDGGAGCSENGISFYGKIKHSSYAGSKNTHQIEIHKNSLQSTSENISESIEALENSSYQTIDDLCAAIEKKYLLLQTEKAPVDIIKKAQQPTSDTLTLLIEHLHEMQRPFVEVCNRFYIDL